MIFLVFFSLSFSIACAVTEDIHVSCSEECGPKRFPAPNEKDCDRQHGLKCFCEDGCWQNGTCKKGTGCKAGHTGLYCQYYFWNDAHPFLNGVSNSSCMGNRVLLFDDDLYSCEDAGLTDLLINCDSSRRFLYLEITHSYSSSSGRDITLAIEGRKCEALAIIEVDRYTSHVTCPRKDPFQNLTLTYNGINLCEVRMVVGMDVASQQNTTQSFMIESQAATSCLPVNDVYSFEDPVTNYSYGQCSSTSKTNRNVAVWGVVFSIPSTVLSFSAVVRADKELDPHVYACIKHIKPSCWEHTFYFLSENGYILHAKHLLQNSKALAFWTNDWQYRTIKVYSGFDDFSLCRVNVFGDHSCSRGTYGPHCGLRCSCNHGGCAVASGLCPKLELQGNCPNVSHRDSSTTYFWGPDCLRQCHCNSPCDRTTGKCATACVYDAYGFPYCDKTCYCKDGCTSVPEECKSGCTSGSHTGPYCNETCVLCRSGMCDAAGNCLGSGLLVPVTEEIPATCSEECGSKRFPAPNEKDCDRLHGLKCFCEDGCWQNGNCLYGTGCKAGHTGLYCQYYFWNDAHPFLNGVSPSSCMGNRVLLFDDDLNSCEDAGLTDLLIGCESKRRFLYLEITHSYSFSSGRNITLAIEGRKCEALAIIEVDRYTSHVTCPRKDPFQNLTLTYNGINLCEVRMVVGMDVASQQNTTQSSLNKSQAATSCLPVNDVYSFEDPVTLYRSGQCSSASMIKGNVASWCVNFSIPSTVLGFSAIVRADTKLDPDVHECLLQKKPSCWEDSFLFYTDEAQIAHRKHLVLDPKAVAFWTDDWHYRAIKVYSGFPDFSLCRVNVFGDHSCSRGTYGPHCGLRCSCNHGGCAVASGLCPKLELQGVCPKVTHEEDLTITHFWGPDCLRQCHCNSQCDRTTGKCDTACANDAYGFPYCDKTCYCKDGCASVPKECESGCTSGSHTGPYCNETCVRCRDGMCIAAGNCLGSGVCAEEGKKGPECLEDCPQGRTGVLCHVSRRATSSGANVVSFPSMWHVLLCMLVSVTSQTVSM